MTTKKVFERVQEIQSVINTRAIEKHYAEGGDSVLEFPSAIKWRPNYIEVYLVYDKQFGENGHEETNVYISMDEVDLNEEEWAAYIEDIKQNAKKSLLQIAYEIAHEAFANKVDKSGSPYINHIYIVAEPFTRGEMEYNDKIHNKDLEIVAVLHNLLEDCEDWSIERLRDLGFSEAVLNALIAITRTNNESYSDYIERVSKNNYATQVKIADLEHNMDITRLNSQLTSDDVKRIEKYHKAYLYLKAIATIYNKP